MSPSATQIQPTTHTLEVPTAVLAYDVRRNDSTTEPILLLIGSPMGAAGFGTLSQHFRDRTLVTYDPRGSERSHRTDGVTMNTPMEHADDLHRLIAEVGGPVDLFASSGGAVNALALVAKHPEDVRILVAHEPPAFAALPDREAAIAAARDIHATYMAKGFGAGMAKFIALVAHKGEIPADWVNRPDPDPQMFGLPTEDDGSRDDPLLGMAMIGAASYEPDFEAIRKASTRIVIAGGVESKGEMAYRGGAAVAERLGLPLTEFPSGHGGFAGGEYGQTGDPDAFASRLREVLTANS